ncbi:MULTISPECIES: hypothetical protein [unclassified Moraxella]|uniref:hypothetical protein n=1 Tax=unclassified Moraxella TaxID=2685852 RepID=UPI003AF90DFE
MSYITTNHRFLIDDKHPTDVFDEMENFFSLYTVAIDDLQQVSIQLSVPPSFDLTGKKLGEGYKQFTKALKYTLPDIHILPVKVREKTTDSENDTDEDDTPQDDDNSLILLIQRLDGAVVEENEDEKPSFYQSVLGKIMPRFGGEKTQQGLYPQRQQIELPTPITPQPPVQRPTQAPIQQPRPPIAQAVLQPPIQPIPNPQPTQPYQQPQGQAVPRPQISPVPNPVPVTPIPTATPSPVPTQSPTQLGLQRLPNIAKSAKPYQQLLTQAIVKEAEKQAVMLKGQPINQITLKSSDSLTTAMIEQLFFSFNHSKDKTQTAHDALDLVSYGHEVLKSPLANIGVTLSDEATFGLKTNYPATPADTVRLQRGEVFANEIKLAVKLKTDIQTSSNSNAVQTPTAQQSSQYSSQSQFNLPPRANRNAQGIALLIKVQDSLGERQQKVSQFPIVFAPSQVASQPNVIRVFSQLTANQLSSNTDYFQIIELDGQVMLGELAQGITVQRQGQVITPMTVLMPNNVLSINGGALTVQLLMTQK